MKTYVVNMREVWIQPVSIRADSIEEAVERVADGEGDFLGSNEYSHSLDKETWSVEVGNETYYNKDGRW